MPHGINSQQTHADIYLYLLYVYSYMYIYIYICTARLYLVRYTRCTCRRNVHTYRMYSHTMHLDNPYIYASTYIRYPCTHVYEIHASHM